MQLSILESYYYDITLLSHIVQIDLNDPINPASSPFLPSRDPLSPPAAFCQMEKKAQNGPLIRKGTQFLSPPSPNSSLPRVEIDKVMSNSQSFSNPI